jgi:hypothetical protein
MSIAISNWSSIELRQFIMSNWIAAEEKMCPLKDICEFQFGPETIIFRGFSQGNGQWTEVNISHPEKTEFLPA